MKASEFVGEQHVKITKRAFVDYTAHLALKFLLLLLGTLNCYGVPLFNESFYEIFVEFGSFRGVKKLTEACVWELIKKLLQLCKSLKFVSLSNVASRMGVSSVSSVCSGCLNSQQSKCI